MTDPAATVTADHDRARTFAGLAIILLLVAAFVGSEITGSFATLTRYGFMREDAWLAPLFVAACLVRPTSPAIGTSLNRRREWQLVAACLFLSVAVCWVGRELVFLDFDVSPDERLVGFDAAIFRTGALAGPLAPEWREFAGALNQTFILPVGANEAWVSSYLPVNAALHALVGLVADEDLTAPLLVAGGGFVIWRIALLLWPDSFGARATTLLLYFGSSQIIVTGMTKYAMTGHLALNLCWLWLFLRDRPRSHFGAMVVGFFATGLHQPLFHPLFVLPFFGLMAAERKWRLLAVYLAAYASIGIFWLSWPMLIASLATGPAIVPSGVELSFLDRLLSVASVPDRESIWLMSANLVRFVAWQHLLLLPLAAIGLTAFWKSEPLCRALAMGTIIPIIVLWVILPWQGPGWGYRYLHPFLGNLVLLGGWGWLAIERRGFSLRRELAWSSLFSIAILIPVHSWMAHQRSYEVADVDRLIGAIDADVAVVDWHINPTVAYNSFDLSNRPIRLRGGFVEPVDVPAICRHRTLRFVSPTNQVSDEQRVLMTAAERAGCDAQLVVIPVPDVVQVNR